MLLVTSLPQEMVGERTRLRRYNRYACGDIRTADLPSEWFVAIVSLSRLVKFNAYICRCVGGNDPTTHYIACGTREDNTS